MSSSKPAFQTVVDLGLRDVGVKNDPRRLAGLFARLALPLLPLTLLFVLAVCAIVKWTGAGAWILVPFLLGWTGGLVWLSVRMARRSPVVVVKVNAEGTNQVTYLLTAHLVLFAVAALALRDPLLIPVVVLTAVGAPLLWRSRRRVPEVLRTLRLQLAEGESVLGDGIGMARGARTWSKGFRLVVATDRRLLVASASRSIERSLVVDAPYAHVTRFGIEWKAWGRLGVLSLDVTGADGSETQVITSIAPANLMSIARALESHGVHTDDPGAVSEAERAWEEAQRREVPRGRLLDRAAMRTREFDNGLWLLVALATVTFYLNPFGVGLAASTDTATAVLVTVLALGGICGYVSGTKASLAYVAPLNLLVCPAFFFADAGDVISAMLALSAAAALGLWAGSELRRRPTGGGDAPAGRLRQALSGARLVRISASLLAAALALVVVSGVTGFELITVRLAIAEVTGNQVPVDGRSNLTGNAASLIYTPGPDLHEFITDEHWGAGPNDGARWELRSSWTKGYNVVSLAHYVFEPHLDSPRAVADFVADKDREHRRLAGFRVSHTERVLDGRKGYVWSHGSRRGYWYYAAWFPQPVDTVRVECVTKRQKDRFKRLCAEAVRSLEFN